MLPDDPRHGIRAGYIAGCREECCRAATRDYERQRYFDHVVLGLPPRNIDKTGSVRRIHALQALGWSAEDLSRRMGYSRAYLNVALNRDSRRGIHQDTAAKIRAIYDELSMKLPTETRCTGRQRQSAREKGWLPPLCWDDETIDDPAARPTGHLVKPVVIKDDRRNSRKRTEVDPSIVDRILAGANIPSTPAEKREVTRIWIARGGSQNELERRTGWNVRRYVDRTDGAA